MAFSTGALVVFALVAVAVALFVTEALPPDMTAIGVLVGLAVLEPYTDVPPEDAIAGFASPAVVTIIAMYVLSEGVEAAGVVGWLGAHLERLTDGDDTRLLGSTTTATGLFAGVVNNTPVVAVFIPMVSDLADDAGISPSKFLMPLSFAAMLGGTLTLVGSSINLLASDVSEQLLGHPIGMFEFTPIGVLVFLTGVAYLLTVGYWLTPARLEPAADVTAEYALERHLAQVRVREDSPLVGRTAKDLFLDADLTLDLDVLQIDRERTVLSDEAGTNEGLQTRTVIDTYIAGSGQPIEADDLLTVRANRQVLNRFAEDYDLQQLPRERVDAERLEAETHPGMLVEAVVPPDSDLVGETPTAARLTEQFDTTVVALRRGDEVIREGLADRHFRAGDTVLLQTTESAIDYLRDEDYVIPLEQPTETPDSEPPSLSDLGVRAPLSVGILVAAVLLAALTPLSIPVTALGGVVALVATGCLSTTDAYDAVSWNVVFLLAGILPLGAALQRTGGAAALGDAIGSLAVGLPPVVVVALVYLLAALLAAVVTPVATVVLLGPVAVDTARTIGADPFAFVLATLFGASAAFITPIGYQTNLMVYGPGGYRFTDYLRVGLPLLAVLSVVATGSIVALYGV